MSEKFELPVAPKELTGVVKAWSEAVVIPTYLPMAADKNPMYLEKRVYQGSSGCVYPLPIVDRISDEKVMKRWEAVHIENEFVRLMILPEIGGRIHVGMDKTNGYDFFYRQNVIKPALVGLAGPWISGGVEFNWPQHHRPSTFMPVEVEIEEGADGSVTVWCSEHEPMNRMKGMHGVCLRPGSSVVELKVRLYNRTNLVQTFLWWANVAARVHEWYQSFFPGDVHYVADHAKRAMSAYPLCAGKYYGVDYGRRGREGVAAEEMPTQFVPPSGAYGADDLSWYANIPVPTSYMAMGSRADFFGGYDHRARAGVVHVANHHISPGKKQWTWGNQEFGYAWDRNLTESDGPYIELMAGVYTDNQPDFSFLHPGETRTWSQYWYPIREIGPAVEANVEGAVSVILRGGKLRGGVAVTKVRAGMEVRVEVKGARVETVTGDAGPAAAIVRERAVGEGVKISEVRVVVVHAGREILKWKGREEGRKEVPEAAKEPALPEAVGTNEELWLIGLHLMQYRHATRRPEDYWREAVRRDAGDTRCLNGMGVWHLRRGEFAEAAVFLRRAIAALTAFNPNPYDGEAFYYLGVALRYLGDEEGAYGAFYKATWNWAWQSAAFFALAEMDCARGNLEAALEHVERVLRGNAEHLQGRLLKGMALRALGREEDGRGVGEETLRVDRLDVGGRYLVRGEVPGDGQMSLDLALDLGRAGFLREAIGVLEGWVRRRKEGRSDERGTRPMVHYALAWLHDRMGDREAARVERRRAREVPTDYCFPSRLEEIVILQAAIKAGAEDARARFYLGNLFYDRRRHEEGILLWEEAVEREPGLATAWRNLGIGYFNVKGDVAKALRAYDVAFEKNPGDARVLYERDQLWKRVGKRPGARLRELEKWRELVAARDDLSIELATLYNQTGQPLLALGLLKGRVFQPWEGGEGLALGQWVRTHLLLGQWALEKGDAGTAREMFEAALESPENLGEAKHLLANQSDVHYFLGRALELGADEAGARRQYLKAAEARGDFQQMAVQAFSEMTYYSALALRALGREGEAEALLRALLRYAEGLERERAVIDYFATSLPTLLLFDDDLQKRQAARGRFLAAQARLGLGEREEAMEILESLVGEDPNHALAADLLANSAAVKTAG
ncbi:MAG: DUF5107 domain-containing protein [Phycisphaerae bacterium]